MEAYRAHNIKINSRKRSPGSKAKTCMGSNERDIMDITNRTTMERYAFEVSAVTDLPSAFSGMDQTRDIPGDIPRAGKDLYERGKTDISEAFIDGCFAPAKKGILLSERRSVAKAPR